jgi:hypothetical protein
MGIQQKLHFFKASHSPSDPTGDTISPFIFPVDLKDPSQEAGLSGLGGGITWAMGSPFLVTKIGWPVLFTWSSRERQVALNLEMGTVSSILVPPIQRFGVYFTMVIDYDQHIFSNPNKPGCSPFWVGGHNIE